MRHALAMPARILLAAALLAVSGGCAPKYVAEDRTDRREKELRIQQHVGGTHHATVVDNGRWFQTFGNDLLVVDSTNGRELGRAEGVPFGEGGALIDLAVEGDAAWAVSERTGLVTFDVSDNAQPKVVSMATEQELGISPLFVSRVGQDLYVTGTGGAVRVGDHRRFLDGQSPTHVVNSVVGPVACVGRKILALSDGRYLGAATALVPLADGTGPKGGYAFVLQGQNGASVGLMSGAFAEVAQAAIPARVRRIRMCGDRLFAVTDKMLYTWRVDGAALAESEEIPLKGGRDIGLVRPNHYAVAGTFGRAMYRHKAEDRRVGDSFYNVERQPGLLEIAVNDGRNVLAGGREGFWLWRVGGEPRLTDKTTDLTTITHEETGAAWGSARLVQEKQPDGSMVATAVELRHDGTVERYEPDGAPHIRVMELVDGDLWIGHDHGVDVLRHLDAPVVPDPKAAPGTAPAAPAAPPAIDPKTGKPRAVGRMEPIATWRFEGPVLFIYPERLGGGAAMVSLHGGFVLAKPTVVGEAPKFKGHGDVK
jgi:hypothetical protein